jgi:hypothetical protein
MAGLKPANNQWYVAANLDDTSVCAAQPTVRAKPTNVAKRLSDSQET